MEKHIIAIRYGLIWSAVYVVLTMSLYLFDHTMIQNFGVGIVLFLIGIVFMYFSGMDTRKEFGGFMTWKEALIPCWVSSIVYSLISVLFMAILYNFIDPDLAEQQKEAQIKWIENFRASMGDIEAEKAIERIQEQNPFGFGNLLIILASSLLIYFIISSLIALVLKKEDPNKIFNTYQEKI